LGGVGERGALHGRALGDALVGVHRGGGPLAGEALHEVLHGGDARGTADEQHAAQLAGGDARVAERLRDRAARGLYQIARDAVERRARDGLFQMQGPLRALREEGEVDDGRLGGGELLFRLLGRLADALHGHLIVPKVDAGLVLERLDQVRRDARVEIVASEVVVARGGEHLDHVVADFDDGHVEGAAAEIVHHDHLRLAVVETVGERRGGGLVDDAQHVEPRDAAGVFSGLALHVVEVRGHGDDGVGDALVEERLRVGAQLAQDHRGDLLRRVRLSVDVRAPVGAHVALHRGDGSRGVHGGLAQGDGADEPLAFLGERDG